VTIEPSIPPHVFKGYKTFGVHFFTSVADDPSIDVIVNTSQVPSPLVGHTSVLLDIDVYFDRDVPQADDELWAAAERLHVAKNNVFEGAITDRARELFDHA